jgi:hypothetical protein
MSTYTQPSISRPNDGSYPRKPAVFMGHLSSARLVSTP